jgi:hypothetical protein
MREFDGYEDDGDLKHIHKRSLDGEAIAHFHRRVDAQAETQQQILLKLNEMSKALTEHISREEVLGPALEEMAEMWGRSKAIAWMFTKLASFVAISAAAWTWIRDHVK